jgi:hypothetical protein
VDPVLRGLAVNRSEELDARLVDEVRNFLFGPPGAGGLDLAALNLQRGRDHGLAAYDDLRAAYGLARRASLDGISSDPEVVARLAAVYRSVDEVDAWVGGLCEDPLPGALVGELIARIVGDQFERLRAGDRFWWERCFHGPEREEIETTRLVDLLRRNTGIGDEIGPNPWLVPGAAPALPAPPAPRPLVGERAERVRSGLGAAPRPR